jgi:3-oxoacyl-[acyl-carrier protein] reductase
MIDTGLKDRVALVTGANHGIGAATARAFAYEGAQVFISYLRLSPEDYGISMDEANKANTAGPALYRARQAASVKEVVETIRARGGQAEAWEADLADPATIPQLFDRAEKAFGPVDVLVNNATHCRPDTFIPHSRLKPEAAYSAGVSRLTITAEAHDDHFAVNSRAVALMMAEYAHRHVERGARWGRIVNISTDGASAFSGEISYGVSKHALESYSRAAASELGQFGITVNIISPGPVQTGYIPSDLEEKLLSEIPLGRIGQPEDIADAIVFFASEQAGWITGQLIYVAGGHVMPL